MGATFRQAMESAGLLPGDIVADGRWRRCPTSGKPRKRNGAYSLSADGLRGWFKDWQTDLEMNEWRGDDVRSATKRIRDEAEEQRQRERDRAARIRAIGSAREFWGRSHPLNRPHPYIERKGLTPLGCAGLRMHEAFLVVPVLWNGRIVSVQSISIDGEKRFWPGAPVKAGAYAMERPDAAVTCFVEGLATGLAIYQSIRKARVIVAFDCGNLLPVIERVKPTGSVVICADNDHRTKAARGVNPGLEKARNAADLLGCGVAYPQGIEGSDWADYLAEVGEGAARRLERAVLAEARYVMAGSCDGGAK